MAIVWYEHFETYGGDNLNLAARGYIETTGFIPSSGRTGTFCWSSAGGISEQRLIKGADAPMTTCGQSVAFRVNSLNGGGPNDPGLRFRVGNNSGAIRVVPNSNLGISVFQNDTFIGQTPNNLYTAGDWHHLEALVITGNGNASVAIRVNNTLQPAFTGLTIDDITGFGIAREFAFINEALWDDWVVWDTTGTVNNTWIGDTFLIVAEPNADAPLSDWIPDSGTNRFSRVSEFSPDDGSFISANNVGDTQEFAHVAPNLPIGAIAAIATQVRVFKTDSGASSIEVGLASNTQTSMGDEKALAVGQVVHSHISNLNPDGNQIWTQSAAQAARLRIRRVL